MLTPEVVEHELNPDVPGGLSRFIVKYKPASELAHASGEKLSRTLNDAASHANTTAEAVREMHDGAKVVSTDKELTVAEADAFLDALMSDPRVDSVSQDDWVKPFSNANDSMWGDQWSLHDVTMDYIPGTWSADVDKAWDLGVDGSGQTIAVIDTGVIANHPDLKNKIAPGYDMISDAKIALDGDGRDADPADKGNWQVPGEYGMSKQLDSTWHGSHVAGIAAAQTNNGQGMAGSAPGAKILPVRIMGKCGGHLSDMLDAMVWSARGDVPDVPANPNKASIINLSTGVEKKCSRFQETIDKVNSLGATIVAAAGNGNVPTEWTMPANCEGVITVGATGASGKRASYSNFGPEVDIAASGGDTWSEDAIAPNGSILNPVQRWRIHSTVTDSTTTPGNPSYGPLEGTSMATPLVAGVIALMKQTKPGLSNDQILSAMQSTASKFQVDPSQEVDSITRTKKSIGAGISNAEAAVRSVKGLPAITSAPVTTKPTTSAPGSVHTVTATKTTTVTSAARQTNTVNSTATSTRTSTVTSTRKPAPITVTQTSTLRPSTATKTVTSTSTKPLVITTTTPPVVTKTPEPATVTQAPVTSTRPNVTVSTTTTRNQTVTETETERVTEPGGTKTVTLAPVTSTVTQCPVTTTPAPKTVTSTVVTTVPAETVVTTPAPVDATSTVVPAPVTKTVTETSTAVVTEPVTTTSTVTSVVNETGGPVPVVTTTVTVVEEPVDNQPAPSEAPAPGSSTTDKKPSVWTILAAIFGVATPILLLLQNLSNGGSFLSFLPMFRS